MTIPTALAPTANLATPRVKKFVSDTTDTIDFWNDKPRSEPKSPFDEFLFALIYLADERGKKTPNAKAIDNWYRRAQGLFDAAISEAVKQEIEKIDLRIVMENRP